MQVPPQVADLARCVDCGSFLALAIALVDCGLTTIGLLDPRRVPRLYRVDRVRNDHRVDLELGGGILQSALREPLVRCE
jgi:hypothetical protein